MGNLSRVSIGLSRVLGNKRTIPLILTIATLFLIIGSVPVFNALSIIAKSLQPIYHPGDIAGLVFGVHIKLQEQLPIQGVSLNVNGPISFSCQLPFSLHQIVQTINCGGQNILVKLVPESNLIYGHGYGYVNFNGYGYNLGYANGYSGFGYNSYGYRVHQPTQFTYEIEWFTPTDVPTGTYNAQINIHPKTGLDFSNSTNFEIASVITTTIPTTTIPPTPTTTIPPTTTTTVTTTSTITTTIPTNTTNGTTEHLPPSTSGGGPGGGGGPSITWANTSNSTGLIIDNFSSPGCITLSIKGKILDVCVHFITATSALVSVNGVNYTLIPNTPISVDPTNGYNYFAELLKINYVGLFSTLRLYLYATPIQSPTAPTTTVTPTTVPTTTVLTLPTNSTIVTPPPAVPPIVPILVTIVIAIIIAYIASRSVAAGGRRRRRGNK